MPQLSPPLIDDGSYGQPPQQYGPPPPQYGGGQYRINHYSGQTYGNTNNLTGYNIYRQMYGYDNPHKAPNYGPPPAAVPIYGSPPMSNYGNAPPSNAYNEPPPQYGPPPAYGQPPPPPSYQSQTPGNSNYESGNGPIYVQAYDQGYHEEASYHAPDQPNYGNPYNPPIDYSKYVSPMPYSELSEYIRYLMISLFVII